MSVNALEGKKYVLIIPDGAADLHRDQEGKSPLGRARIPAMDSLSRLGVCGRLQTLSESLARGSLVATLGLMGWNPHEFHPNGRASAEVLGTHGVALEAGDLAFRMNLVRLEGGVLASYNGDFVKSSRAAPLTEKIINELDGEFPEFELYHNSDFRNTLVVREAQIRPEDLVCIEPHENEGCRVDLDRLVRGKTPSSSSFAGRLNAYLVRVASILGPGCPNALLPWSASKAFQLPSFASHTGFSHKVGVIGAMDFLHGIAIAGGMDFFPEGSGRPDTNFEAKGSRVLELLRSGYGLIVCHINAPDEASHMGDLALKIRSLEAIDQFVVRPVLEYFDTRSEELGGVAVLPDHYTNVFPGINGDLRTDAHSLDPVPFALWDGREKDRVSEFCEESAGLGRYGRQPIASSAFMALLTGSC
jgi:2,3-bisphosphoglycerate-independent phosphoglycerate mutase